MKITAHVKIDHGDGWIDELHFDNESGFQFYNWALKVCAALPGIGELLKARDERLEAANGWINRNGQAVGELIGGWAGRDIVSTLRDVADTLLRERRQHAIK